MNHPIAFRPYTASDHAALIGIIREAWHYDRFASPKTAARMARLFLDSCLASQTFTQVAVLGDVPVGIIMAKDRLQHLVRRSCTACASGAVWLPSSRTAKAAR